MHAPVLTTTPETSVTEAAAGMARARVGSAVVMQGSFLAGILSERAVVRAAAAAGEGVAGVRAADERGEPLLVLGGGSNLVVADQGFDGTVIRIATRGVRLAGDGQAGTVTVTAAAGEDWDALARRCVADGLAGTECLAGIPGLVGATPTHDFGAYAPDASDTLGTAHCYDRPRPEPVSLPPADLGLR